MPIVRQAVIAFSRMGELAARHLADHDSAQVLCDWAMEVGRCVYAGKPHWNAAMALNNAGLVHQLREQFVDAERLYADCRSACGAACEP